MSKYEDLVAKLREIFQIDRPDLDFGVYRVLNARADEINDYLSKRLKERVAEALTAGASDNAKAIRTALAKAEKGAEDAGIDPADSPKVKQLKVELAAASTGAAEHENQVFSHLLTFFSRYYDKGDFISQRRYKGDTYAIPYSGEEVVLHWANRDQYYIKSGESFSNYSFKLDDGRSVHFRLVAADTAKDNRKDNDKERRFMLAEARTVSRLDDDGEPYDETIDPVSVENGELIIRFDYATAPKGTKQDKLVEEAVAAVLAHDAAKTKWLDLAKRAPTEKKPQRTLLEKHLTTYTQKNTADYFIHKDLGPFLRRELDFYIKNEVMHLDDVQNAEAFAAIEKNLRMIQCLRAIAQDLITFLASIEDFQKKLWLKRKFVVAAEYCVTLDRVPEALYPAIAANGVQWAQWHELGMREGSDAGSVDDLKAQEFLMVDTNLFDAGFRAELLRALPDLDATTDGLLVHGDNFQALTLLQERYRDQVKCVYIDPPYNTDAGPISYKNGYRSSSWVSLMYDRVKLGRQTLSAEGILTATIDDYQYRELNYVMEDVFGAEHLAATVVIRMNPSGRPLPQGFAQSHEYAIFAKKTEKAQVENLPRTDKQNSRYRHRDEDGRMYMWELFRKRGSNSERADRPSLYYPIYLKGETFRVPKMEYDEVRRDWDILEEPLSDETVLYPIDDNGTLRTWRGSPDDLVQKPSNYQFKEENGVVTFYYKFRPNSDGVLPLTNWIDAKYSATEHGTGYLKNFFENYNVFSYPKSIYAVEDCLRVAGATKSAVILDYFAGSGTTGHAVINLNRQDNGERKYILAEQGAYFDTVIKPRLQKAVFSADWKGGKPTSSKTGISHAFKALKIESYEDALNNLTLERTDGQQNLLDGFKPEAKDDYLMRYMLDVETKGSLLSVDDFQKPFDYALKIAVDSAGAFETRKVDLIETFSYLIGLSVGTVDLQMDKGYALVTGRLPSGERTMVVWRDCEVIGYEALTALFDSLGLAPGQVDYDLIYVNGDHNVPDVLVTKESGVDVTEKMTLRRIEPVFLDAMFNVDDV